MPKKHEAKNISQSVGTVIAKICYPIADELGQEFGERISKWRQKNATNILISAEKGFDKNFPKGEASAHPKLVHQILDSGSWSDSKEVQDMWSGLLVSSCTTEGCDESNLIFINALKNITTLQAKLINYLCETATPVVSQGGWIHSESVLSVTLEALISITGESDVHRLDRELDHLRALELIEGGFSPEDTVARINPSALCLQMFVRCKGYSGSPVEFYGLSADAH